ncbi:MAG: hypothetical protein ACK460_08755, partial [Microcystis sp.]|uniref:hypothetical protein n=1 Tax=Microcystis sp. TaxID=1127 RepID=UPI00391A8338
LLNKHICSGQPRQHRSLSYSLCDQFNLYRTDQSLCPLCLCGSFQSLAGGNISYKIHFTHQTQESRQETKTSYWTERGDGMLLFKADSPEAAELIIGQHPLANSSGIGY